MTTCWGVVKLICLMKFMATKNKKNSKSYSEDQVVVILDDIQDQFRAFAEGQDILSEKVDGLEKKFDKLEDRLESVASDVIEIKHSLTQKVELKDFQRLEKRVIRLEKAIA